MIIRQFHFRNKAVPLQPVPWIIKNEITGDIVISSGKTAYDAYDSAISKLNNASFSQVICQEASDLVVMVNGEYKLKCGM